MIAYDLDLRCERTSKTEVLFALNEMLMVQAHEGRTVVLIVDEAHNLEWEVLEEIRLLSNLETRQESCSRSSLQVNRSSIASWKRLLCAS
jgi:general secretion pathway protein A